jgi:DNA processing protein
MGNIELLKNPKVAIVGTRKPSQYSKNIAYSLSSLLSKNGLVVVSGGAIGIDIEAHRGAFPNTISIMANSLDKIYPKINRETIEMMGKDALLLSEYEMNIDAHQKRFIHRNRLIVALSQIVVVVEADLDSGSSQTMRIARELGKPIYVIPHRIGESGATNLYIQNGFAKAIFNLEEFAENLASLLGVEKVRSETGANSDTKSSVVDEVLNFCRSSPTYEEAFQKFGDRLFEYEIEGHIQVVNGVVVLS